MAGIRADLYERLYGTLHWRRREILYLARQMGPEIELTLNLEHDTAATDEKALWRTNTTRLIRMEFTGSTFATSGTAYANKTLRIDLTGKWDSWDVLDDDDGATTIEATFIPRYNSVAAHYGEFTVVNANATL